MALDIRGSLKKAKFNNNYYIFVDELFANAVDSFLIRQNQSSDDLTFKAAFHVEFYNLDLEGTQIGFSLSCSDNGVGLGYDQTKAFVTKDTSYKDDLKIEGIGKCKGSGRIQYLRYFSKMNIKSIFHDGNNLYQRTLGIDDSWKEIDEDSFETEQVSNGEIGFKVKLDGLKDDAKSNISRYVDVKHAFSANELRKHILVRFLQRLVTLKEQLGDFCIEFTSSYNDESETNSINREDLPEITASEAVTLPHPSNVNGDDISFEITHYQLDKKEYNLVKNTVALCAKSAIFVDITKKYLKSKTLENNEINGQYHIVLIESSYLDVHVNEQRDGYDLPKSSSDKDQETFLESKISMEEIYDAIEDKVIEMIAPPGWNKDEVVEKVENKYGISASMLTDAKVRIRYGDTEETVVKRVLSNYQEKIIQDTSDIFDIKSEILSLEPDSDDFREKVNELAWRHTSSLKSMDMANLSQVVVRRAAVIEILSLAVRRELACQVENTGRNKDEALVHNIFFPMRKDSTEVSEHDIWILNEEYHYYDYIASDKPLSSFKWVDDELLFESDIDEKISEIMNKNSNDNALKRPDIAIFNKEGAAIIVEFKAPGVSMDDHVGDLMEYAQLLAAKSNGKLKQFYGYLIGSDLNPLRLRGYTKFSNSRGYFGTEDIVEHTTNTRLGEMYSEILFYDDIVSRASARLEVYKNKLGLKLDE